MEGDPEQGGVGEAVKTHPKKPQSVGCDLQDRERCGSGYFRGRLGLLLSLPALTGGLEGAGSFQGFSSFLAPEETSGMSKRGSLSSQ